MNLVKASGPTPEEFPKMQKAVVTRVDSREDRQRGTSTVANSQYGVSGADALIEESLVCVPGGLSAIRKLGARSSLVVADAASR
jgi:hypothetical protein